MIFLLVQGAGLVILGTRIVTRVESLERRQNKTEADLGMIAKLDKRLYRIELLLGELLKKEIAEEA